MKSEETRETRLNVRLQGPLADHVNRQVETALYASHSEYNRALVRRDMAGESPSELESSIQRGLDDVAAGRFGPFDAETIRKRARAELAVERK